MVKDRYVRRQEVVVQVALPLEDGKVSEQAAGDLWGSQPFDLNGDGDSSDDELEDYHMLPVVITLSWEGASGTQTIQIPRIFRKG